MWIWEWAEEAGYDDRAAWGIIGIVFMVLIFVLTAIGLVMLRGVEKDIIIKAMEQQKTRVKENFYKIWKDCLAIGSFRIVLLWVIFLIMGTVISEAIIVFIMDHNAGMSYDEQGVFWIIYSIFVAVLLPVMNMLCNKYGKKIVLLGATAQAVVVLLIFYFIGVNSPLAVYIYYLPAAVAIGAFFTYYVGLTYDCVEIYEYRTGERSEGSLASLTTFSQKLGAAIATFATGALLGMSGYDAELEEQTAEGLQGTLMLGTLVPALLWIVSLLILSRYPVTKRKFEVLCEVLEKKRAGEEYDIEEVKDII